MLLRGSYKIKWNSLIQPKSGQDTMSDLKALIKGLRQANVHHRRFVPELSLRHAMTKDVIRKALEDSSKSLRRSLPI